MKYQEYEYLRAEMNQRNSSFYEYAKKTIHIVFIVLGGALTILGTINKNSDNILLYFICGTIYFIPNLTLYFSARKGYDNLKYICKIAAYITVFYEKKPSSINKVGKFFSWEIVNLETYDKDVIYEFETKDKERTFAINCKEYLILTVFSIIFMLIFTMFFFSAVFTCGKLRGIIFADFIPLEIFKEIIFLVLLIVYILTSFWIFSEIHRYGSYKECEIRRRYLEIFKNYSLKTGHYTNEEIKDRFGDFFST